MLMVYNTSYIWLKYAELGMVYYCFTHTMQLSYLKNLHELDTKLMLCVIAWIFITNGTCNLFPLGPSVMSLSSRQWWPEKTGPLVVFAVLVRRLQWWLNSATCRGSNFRIPLLSSPHRANNSNADRASAICWQRFGKVNIRQRKSSWIIRVRWNLKNKTATF